MIISTTTGLFTMLTVRGARIQLDNAPVFRANGQPTEETVEILELILTDMQECDLQVKLDIAAIPCGVITKGKGWFRSCGRALARAVKANGHVFAGCHATAIGKPV